MTSQAQKLTFFWHDYETFGVRPRRDRPAQFAGLRTDVDLHEIGEPVMVYCKPAPDALPDPESCLLTGILPQTCLQHGRAEFEFAAQIESELARPGTVGVGYNSIRFDDEVTRHLFWRNLIDPYAREWQNDCSRWDLLDVVRSAYALRPEGLSWPQSQEGKPSFKLEHLTAANGLAHEAAHDALSDVRATVALARLVKQQQPRLWDYCLKLRKKEAVQAEIGWGEPKPFLHISGMYPVERGCLAVVWPLGSHPVNKNEVIVWDLAQNPAVLQGLDAQAVQQRLFSKQDELPEGIMRLPIKTIHINKSPIVIGQLKALGAHNAQRWGIDLDQALKHAQVAGQLRLAPSLWADVFARPTPSTTGDVDEDLYGGFIGNNDRRTLNKLRLLQPDQLALERVRFDDARLEELLFRYRARNFPTTLNESDAARWLQHRIERLHSGVGGHTSLAQFFERIDQLSESADERGQSILGALYDYAEQMAPEV
jgi:exodeoxyribonuclease I